MAAVSSQQSVPAIDCLRLILLELQVQ